MRDPSAPKSASLKIFCLLHQTLINSFNTSLISLDDVILSTVFTLIRIKGCTILNKTDVAIGYLSMMFITI